MNSRFVEERSRLGFASANALAVAIGASQVAVKRIEDGASTPGGEMLAAFAQLGADVGYVLTGARSGKIEVNLLGICEAALRAAYSEARGIAAPSGGIRARMSALVYNQLIGKLRSNDDEAQHALSAARLLVESLDDPADPGMLDRNLFVVTAEQGAAAVNVTGNRNRVAGRDMIGGGKGKA